MADFGLIGKKLSHSFSKSIHEKFGLYKYELIELDEDELDIFFVNKNFKGINVTIPYKEKVIKYLDEIDGIAKRISAVNTIINLAGKLIGYNTDYHGLKRLIEENCFNVENKNILILGTGGTSRTAETLCNDLKAKKVIRVSHKEIDEGKVYTYVDFAEVIINTTPVGMFPNINEKPIDIDRFLKAKELIDVIYNPEETILVKEAKKNGIKSINGMPMLNYQALESLKYFKKVL